MLSAFSLVINFHITAARFYLQFLITVSLNLRFYSGYKISSVAVQRRPLCYYKITTFNIVLNVVTNDGNRNDNALIKYTDRPMLYDVIG